jgi:hypothetical protein
MCVFQYARDFAAGLAMRFASQITHQKVTDFDIFNTTINDGVCNKVKG